MLLKFDGRQVEWQPWKNKLFACLRSAAVLDALTTPAPTLGQRAVLVAAPSKPVAVAMATAVASLDEDANQGEVKEAGKDAAPAKEAVKEEAGVITEAHITTWSEAANKICMLLPAVRAVQESAHEAQQRAERRCMRHVERAHRQV